MSSRRARSIQVYNAREPKFDAIKILCSRLISAFWSCVSRGKHLGAASTTTACMTSFLVNDCLDLLGVFDVWVSAVAKAVPLSRSAAAASLFETDNH